MEKEKLEFVSTMGVSERERLKREMSPERKKK
jgi:hypothetical protein